MRWLRDTLCMTGWCCGVAGGFALFLVFLFSTTGSRRPDEDPSQPAAAAMFLFFGAAVCLSAVKAMGGNLNPEHNLAMGKLWRDSSLAEKKERMRFAFAVSRSAWLAGVYACSCVWLLAEPARDDGFFLGVAGWCLALSCGMMLAESVMWAVFIERPIFVKSGLYVYALLYALVSLVVLKGADESDFDIRLGLTLAVILSAPAVIIRLLPRHRRANSVETQLDGGKLANGRLSQAQSPAVNTRE